MRPVQLPALQMLEPPVRGTELQHAEAQHGQSAVGIFRRLGSHCACTAEQRQAQQRCGHAVQSSQGAENRQGEEQD